MEENIEKFSKLTKEEQDLLLYISNNSLNTLKALSNDEYTLDEDLVDVPDPINLEFLSTNEIQEVLSSLSNNELEYNMKLRGYKIIKCETLSKEYKIEEFKEKLKYE